MLPWGWHQDGGGQITMEKGEGWDLRMTPNCDWIKWNWKGERGVGWHQNERRQSEIWWWRGGGGGGVDTKMKGDQLQWKWERVGTWKWHQNVIGQSEIGKKGGVGWHQNERRQKWNGMMGGGGGETKMKGDNLQWKRERVGTWEWYQNVNGKS